MKDYMQTYGQLYEIIAITLVPFILFILNNRFQKWKDKKQAKSKLFLTLTGTPRASPPPLEYMQAINQIDVMLEDNETITTKWRKLYDSFSPTSEHYNNQKTF